MEIAELNDLRRRVKAIWQKNDRRPTPIVHLSDEAGDRNAVGQAFQTLCSEIGVRHVRIDLADGLTESHRETIRRTSRHPRMVVISRIDGLQEDLIPRLHDMLCEDAERTLPVIVCFGPLEQVESVQAAWRTMKDGERRRSNAKAVLAQAGFDERGDPLPERK